MCRENVSRKCAQKRHDESDGVQIGGRVHCGGGRPGIWGALLPSPTSHHLPIQLSGPLCSARLCTTCHEQSSAVLSPPSLLCAGLCKVYQCRAEELPLSRAETNSPPPPALTTMQSKEEQSRVELRQQCRRVLLCNTTSNRCRVVSAALNRAPEGSKVRLSKFCCYRRPSMQGENMLQ